MRTLVLLTCLFFSFHLQAQPLREWLKLPHVPLTLPAFHDSENVGNKSFSPDDLLKHSFIDLAGLSPEEGVSEKGFNGMVWSKADITDDIVLFDNRQESASIVYAATYLSNKDWLKGRLSFRLYVPAEIYIDGEKKTSQEKDTGADGILKEIAVEWVPGKHRIIVKCLTKDPSGKLFSASFKVNDSFKAYSVESTISPLRGKAIMDVLNGPRTGAIQLSSSGKYVLMDKSEITEGKTNRMTQLYRVADKALLYTFYGQDASQIQWIPEEERVSFFLKEGNGNSLYVYDVENRKQERLFKADQAISRIYWSPDRTYLMYTVSEQYTDKDWELRKLDGIEDRQSGFRNRYFLCKYDLNTGLHTRLSWGNLSTHLMHISPDGKKILLSTSKPDYNEYPFRKQSVFQLDVNTLQLDTLWIDRLQAIQCSYSPDGNKLLISGPPHAFGDIGVNIKKGQTVNGYDTQLYIYDMDSKQIQPLTKDFNPAVNNYIWHKDGNIYMTATDTDYVHIFSISPSGKIEKINCPGDIVRSLNFAANESIAFYTASDASYPVRVYHLNSHTLQTTEWENPFEEQYKHIAFGEVNDWDYNYRKGTTIDGRYYLPADFDPNKKYPLIVYYYGGTTPVERTFGGRWPFNLYAANGYVVYVMQPSGAIGFGQEFSARHQNNWAKTTADEIIACTKAFLKAHPFVDAERVGCMGASYGGFTTMYLQTKTDLFACAISHAGISSISSYWGEGYWGYGYSTNASAHSYPWNRKDIYVDQSPLFNADKVNTPILLLHGTSDVNVPVGESIQFYTALKLLGKDAELVLIKNADHAVVDYKQRILWNNTIMAYFSKYLKDQPAWWENIYKDKNL